MKDEKMTKTYLELLAQYVACASVSTDPNYQEEIDKTATWLENLLRENKFSVTVWNDYGNPILLAEHLIDEKLPTILVYGHYDVQPAHKNDGWDNDPFILQQNGDKLIARGSADNKGQLLQHLVSVFHLIKENKLAYNVKFLIEGNEETGSAGISNFIRDNKQLLESDLIMISDSAIAGDNPGLEVSLRGTFNFSLKIISAKHDLHSGGYGGVAPSSVYEFMRLFYPVIEKYPHIGIPGFYEDIDKEGLEEIPDIYTEENLKLLTGTTEIYKEDGVNYHQQIGMLPTLQITGIESGYNQRGYRNSIPAETKIKFNVRTAAGQDPSDVYLAIRQYISGLAPNYLRLVFSDYDPKESVPAVKLPLEGDFIARITGFLEHSFGNSVKKMMVGGTIPIVYYFRELLTTPIVLVPLANSDCNMHAAHENIRLSVVEKGMDFSYRFFSGQ